MFTSIAILIISAILFVYWFRYTCLLILSTRSVKDYAGQVIEANQLSFPAVRQRLSCTSAPTALAELRQSLDRDMRLLSYLRKHAAELGGRRLEEEMLAFDYRIMQAWCTLTRYLFPRQTRAALQEMADILGHFANSIGERATCQSLAE